MKNKIYLLILLAMVGWNCSDKDKTVPDLQKYEVSFSVSGLPGGPSSIDKQQSVTATPSIFDQVNYLTLMVYNSKGYLVEEHTHYAGMNSSVFVTSMEEGTYTAVAIGYNNHSVENVERLQTARFYQFYPGQFFIDKVEFKVGESETGAVNLMMERKVGMLDLDFSDQPGREIMHLSVKIDAMAYQFSFGDMLPVGNSQELLYFNDPHTDYLTSFPVYFLVPDNSSSYKTTITLELTNIHSQVIKTVVLKDVILGVNRKTTIRGKLYNSGPQDFTVSIDDEWSREDTIDF